LISFNLLPHAKKIIGLDTSQGMLDVYEQKAAMDEVAASKLSTMCIDILSMSESEIPQEVRDVDVVVCSMAYHHIDDIKGATRVLASLLRKGGHLLVFDLMEGLSLQSPS
jgi:SAM-dependent methyltransferase